MKGDSENWSDLLGEVHELAHALLGGRATAEQCRRLQDHGVDEFHFYTLNRADLAYAICHILGMRPVSAADSAAAAVAAAR